MSEAVVSDAVEIEEVSAEEGHKMLHAQTMDKLGIGATEFLKRLDAGEYADTRDENVLRLAMLAPFGR